MCKGEGDGGFENREDGGNERVKGMVEDMGNWDNNENRIQRGGWFLKCFFF